MIVKAGNDTFSFEIDSNTVNLPHTEILITQSDNSKIKFRRSFWGKYKAFEYPALTNPQYLKDLTYAVNEAAKRLGR